MPKRLVPALLLLAGCQAVAYKQARESLREVPPPMDHGLDTRVLPSGLTVAAFQVPGQRDATVWLALGGGMADEPEDRPGLALTAVRAAMRAPRGVGGASLLEQLYALGALWEAEVLLDETSLGVRCRPAKLPQVLAALSDLLDDPAAGLTEALVRGAAAEQAAAIARGTGGLEAARDAVRQAALAATPFGRQPPTAASLQGLGLEEARRFLRASFDPSRAILWLSTGGDAEQAIERVAVALRGRAAGDPARPVPPAGPHDPTPPERRGRQTLALEGGDRETLLFAWVAPGLRFQPSASLGGVALREALGRRAGRPDLTAMVSHVSARFLPLDRAGVLLLEVGLEKGADVPMVRDELLGAVRSAGAIWGATSAAEVRLWRLLLRLEREGQLANGWVGPVGRLVRTVGAADAPEWASRNEQAQLGPSVAAWLEAWISPGPTVVAHVRPTGGQAGDSGAARAEGAAQVPRLVDGERSWPTAQSLVGAAVPGVGEVGRLLQRTGLDQARVERLPSGLTLVVLARPGAPFVALDLALPGGTRGPTEGLAARRALQAAESALHGDGCALAPTAVAYADAAVIRTSGPVAWLPAILESVGCWSRSLDAGSPRRPSPDEASGWLALDAVLTGGPVREAAGGRAWADAYLDQLTAAEGAVVVLAGDVEPEAVLPKLRQVFGRFGQSRRGISAPATPPWPRSRRVVLQDAPGATLASARIFLRLPDRTSFTSVEAGVLSRLVQEKVSLKLEPSGFTVGTDSSGFGDAAFQGLQVTGPPALLPAAVAEILGDLRQLRERGPSAMEAAQARWDVARALAYQFDGLAGASAGLRSLVFDGQPLDGWDQAGQALARLDAGALRALLERSGVGAEGLILRGDAATLLPLLRAERLEPEVLAPVQAARSP